MFTQPPIFTHFYGVYIMLELAPLKVGPSEWRRHEGFIGAFIVFSLAGTKSV